MKLTKNQIQQLHTFIKSKGVVWYDVRIEIVDHFANAIKNQLENNKNLTFEEALNKVYTNFGDVKFKNLIKAKIKSINTTYYKNIKVTFLSYFKFPKVLIGILLFASLNFSMSYIEDKNTFFLSLNIVLLIMAFVTFIQALNLVHLKHQFLVLENVRHLGLGANIFAVTFNTIGIFAKNIHTVEFYRFRILLFVLFILIISAMNYVSNKTKESVKQQFPEIIF